MILIGLVLAAMGAFHLSRSVQAFRSGKLVWKFWLSRRETYRHEDITGFDAALALNTGAGILFLTMAVMAFLF